MPLISLRQLLDHAAENNYGIPAFNINNLEQVRAIMEGAKELNSPVILQASKAARKYAGPIFVKKMVEAAMEEFSEIPTVLHQDHGGSPEDCKNCIELGFTSVMMDGSLKEDQKTYVFNFNPNARWSNGDRVTPEDFVWSWQRALTPTLGSQYSEMLFYVKNAKKFYDGEINDFSE